MPEREGFEAMKRRALSVIMSRRHTNPVDVGRSARIAPANTP